MLIVQPAHAQLNNIMTKEITKDTVLTLELSIDEINAVLAGLQELPGKICNPLTVKIQQQAQKQLPAPTEPESK